MEDKPTLDELLTHVDVGTDWLRLGVLLELDMKDLTAIEHERLTIDQRLQHMYALWLKTSPNATRGQLIKALGVIRANTLADKYKKWISSTGRTTATSKDTNTRRHTPSASKQSTAQQSLDITDLQKVLNLLRDAHFNGDWEGLGLQLGLYQHPTLSNLHHTYGRGAALRECLAVWLQRGDGVDKNGGANYVSLANAVERLGQRAVADHIRRQCQIETAQEEIPTIEQCHIETAQEEIPTIKTTVGAQMTPLLVQEGSHIIVSKEEEQVAHQCTGVLFYVKKGTKDLLTITVAKDKGALRNYIEKEYPRAKIDQIITFTFAKRDSASTSRGDYIELMVDAPQDEPTTGWTIKPHTVPCRIYKEDAYNFGKEDYPVPPSCRISVRASRNAVPALCYTIPVEGMTEPRALIIERSRRATSADPVLDIKKDLSYVLGILRKAGFSEMKWKPLGLALGLYHPTLKTIEDEYHEDVQRCLWVCLGQWLLEVDGVDGMGGPTMVSLCDALEDIGEEVAADYIIRELKKKRIQAMLSLLKPDRQKLMTILIYIIFLFFIICASYGPQSSFIAPLPGVEVVRSTNIVVPGGTTIMIERFGLVIESPPDALPAGLFSVINIRLGISGPYIYPDSDTNHTMVAASPVYWLSSSKELLKPLKLGIRHYTSQKSIMKVYTANDDQINMSYIFEEVPNVTVSRDYVYFSVDHFSGFSGNSTETTNTTFCGTLYYQRSTDKFQWDYIYLISQCSQRDLHDLDKSWSEKIKSHHIEFEENSTEIKLVMKSNASENWTFVANFENLVYTKESLQKNYIAYNMQFSLQWTRNDGLPASEALQFFLKGAQAPKIITVKTQSIDYWEYYLDNKFFIVVPSVVTIMIGFFILILALYCKGNNRDIVIIFTIMIIIILIILILYCFQDHIEETIKYSLSILQYVLVALVLYLVFYRLVPEMRSTLLLEQLWNKLLSIKNSK